MIGEFTYEAAGFNPTALIVTLALIPVVVLLGIWSSKRSDSETKFSNGSGKEPWQFTASMFIGMLVVFSLVFQWPVEGKIRKDVNEALRDDAAISLLNESGYENIRIDYPGWTGSDDGLYAKGVIAHVEDTTYVIYKED